MTKTIFSILEKLLVVLMVILVLDVLWQVASRYLFSSPSSFTDEVARYLMMWIGLLGAAYVSGEQGHIAIDLFMRKQNENVQKKLKVVISILIIIFAVIVLVLGGVYLVYTRFILEVTSPALHLGMGYVYLVVPLSGFLIIYFEMARLFLSNEKLNV